MIFVLFGEDSFSRLSRRNELLKKYKEKLGQPAYFDWQEKEAKEAFLFFLKNQSIFQQGKLVVVFGALGERDAELKNIITETLADPEKIIIFSEEKKPDKSFEFIWKPKKGSKEGVLEEFSGGDREDWGKILKRELESRSLSLGKGGEEILFENFNKDIWGLVSFLEKAFLRGIKTISSEYLTQEGVLSSPNFWATINGLRSDRLSTRLSILEGLLSKKEPAQKIFYLLSSGPNEKAPLFAALDRFLKSGKLDYEEALLDLLTI